MIFTKIPLQGNASLIDIEPYEDFRGKFARTVCYDDFALNGLNANFVQQSTSFNPKVGTLRGMHWQVEPFAEEKLVRATRGAIFDVIVDIRPASNTFKKWFSVELSAENRRQIYVPKGFAHGFQTLLPDTEILYEMTTRHELKFSMGFLWNDPSINILWPVVEERLIGIRDSSYPNFNDVDFNGV
jgi:dTDP-4-dehydrorhamnose 3,5-epimerase